MLQLKIIGAAIANGAAIGGGIAVHAFTPTANLSYDNDKDVKQVVGFNAKHVLQLNDAKKRTNFGSTELRSHLKYGSDLGIDIIQGGAKTGYVFSLSNYNTLSDKDKKQFVSLAAYALAEQIARTEITNECVCHLHKGLFAQELCVAKDTKSLPPVVCIPNLQTYFAFGPICFIFIFHTLLLLIYLQKKAARRG